jgi:DNA-binding transcriptional LysR family regulator
VRPGDRSGLDWDPLMTDPLWLVLPPGHRFTDAADVHFADLAEERWVLGCLKTAGVVRDHAALAGFDLRISCSATDYFFALSLVGAGVGICLLPEMALDQVPAGLSVVPLAWPRPSRHIGVVVSQRRSAAARPYVDLLAAELKSAASRL